MSENFSSENVETTEPLEELEKAPAKQSTEVDIAEITTEETAQSSEESSVLTTISSDKEFKDDEEFVETNLDYAQELDNPDELIKSQEQFDFQNADPSEAANFDISPQSKKYVVAITPQNIPFFDKYDPEERADLVNELLNGKQEEIKQQDRNYRFKKLIKHLSIAAVTTFIALPLIFTFINKSIEATLNSYQEVQNSFEKLYIQKGGIKKKDMTKYRDLEY